MGFYLTALEASTEGITAEEVSDTIEQMKNCLLYTSPSPRDA